LLKEADQLQREESRKIFEKKLLKKFGSNEENFLTLQNFSVTVLKET
jgi:hypothetical protein